MLFPYIPGARTLCLGFCLGICSCRGRLLFVFVAIAVAVVVDADADADVFEKRKII